uniref:Structure-specific endonuclease subunit SLX4 n=1 Tax=Anopheles epiroticus TaxID=199890 RepID=A0A182P3P7_9DIPT
MSKRLKFAKLRLAKPNEPADPAPIPVPAEANVGPDSTVNGKTSKYFAKRVEDVCTDQDTFIVIHSEDSDDENDASAEQNSRRRTQEPPVTSPNEGPKLPKLRKKTCEGNALISNFLSSQPSQKANEDDDFEEAKPGSVSQPKKTKVQRATKKPAKVPRRPRNQVDIRKVFKKYKTEHEVLQELLKEHSASEQIDPEQLQLALAMSRSMADQDCGTHPTTNALFGDEEDSTVGNSSGSSEERRIVSIRTTLEQFGFRCKNSYTDYDLNVIFGSAGTKNVKKIKHKRATNLQLRSREELTSFIDGQAIKLFPLVLNEQAPHETVMHELESIQSYLSNLFWIAQTELSSEQLMEKYYVPELLEANPAPVGCMLKDWNKIPGRDCTPERETVDTVTEAHSARMSSPDLFDDAERDNNALVSQQNDRSCETPIKYVEQGDDTKEEHHEMQDSGSLIDNSNFVVEKEKTRAFEESPAIEASDIVDVNCADASTNINYEQALENATLTSCSPEILNTAEIRTRSDQEDIIVLGDNTEDEEDKFVTAQEMSECPQPAFHQSSENIFDDTDLNPMVSFEAYSSEEEKISAASQAPMGTVITNGDDGMVDNEPITQGDEGKCNTTDQYDTHHQTMLNGEHANSAYQTVGFLAEKDLSFHRLAIKARLSEANTIETVDLIDSAPSNGNLTPNLHDLDMESVTGTQCSEWYGTQDDMLCISDDEVNYSIRGDPSRVREMEPVEEEARHSGHVEDPDMTIVYTTAPGTEKNEHNQSILPLNCNDCGSNELEPEILTISSNENDSEPVITEMNCAENTFAYLDNLVKEFNLPPIQSQQIGVLEKPKSNPAIRHLSSENPATFPVISQQRVAFAASKSNSNISKLPIQKDANDGIQELSIDIDDNDKKELEREKPIVSDELSNYLNNYEEPNFDDRELACNIITSQSFQDKSIGGIDLPSSKALSRVKSCTQFDSPKIRSPLRRTPSETVLLSSSTPNQKDALEQRGAGGFENKFDELKKAAMVLGRAEYVISTVNVSQRPPNYDNMSTPEIERELFKYGLKSLQRSKAIRVLNHLFEVMHPMVSVEEARKENLVIEAIPNLHLASQGIAKKCKPVSTLSSSTALKRPRKCAFKLDTNITNYFLPSKPRKKVYKHKQVSESESLQRHILRYEPIDLDEIYGILKEGGLRYETNDLIAFLDKHCITFRTGTSSGERTAKLKKIDGGK